MSKRSLNELQQDIQKVRAIINRRFNIMEDKIERMQKIRQMLDEFKKFYFEADDELKTQILKNPEGFGINVDILQ